MIDLLVTGERVSNPSAEKAISDAQKFRKCLSQFATGVTVVTCSDSSGRPYGITANSFSSVSLDPPLVLWNIAKVSNSLDAFLDAEHFAINVLAEGQRNLSLHFARSDHTLFDSVDFEYSDNGVPIIPGTLACFECNTYQIHDCGDHYIIVGEVQHFRYEDGAPLVFFRGRYVVTSKEQSSV